MSGKKKEGSGGGIEIAVIVLSVIVVLAFGGVMLWPTADSEVEPTPEPVIKVERKLPSVSATNVAETVRGKKRGPRRQQAKSADGKAVDARRREKLFRFFNQVPEADQKVIDDVQTALDGGDFVRTRAAAAAALTNSNAHVRADAVRALGWFGDKALTDLTKAMSDRSPEVAEAARDQVEQALNGMEDSHAAFSAAAMYVGAYAKDKEAVTMFIGIMESAGMRITEPDDADSPEDVKSARSRRRDIVTAMAELIGRGGETAEAARSSYQLITGDEWRDAAAAEAWANAIPEPAAKTPEPETEPEEPEADDGE